MMSARTDRPAALLALFERHGFATLDTPILQPAGLFLELSGEDIRRRLFLTQEADGSEHCLRPEHTIPVCRHHLASGRAAGSYGYCGPVFRQRQGEPGEFLQAGIESIGAPDALAADAAVLAIALEGLALWSVPDLSVRVGDMDLIEAVMAALGLPAPLHRRIVRRLAAGGAIADLLSPPRPAGSDYAGLLAAIEGQDPKAARAFVEDVISIAGITTVGGRSAAEIAERFLSRAANREGAGERATAVLARYLAIEAPLPGAASALRSLARDEGLAMEPALARFEARLDRLEARAIPTGDVTFSARFVRNFDYYTGFVFEAAARTAPPGRVLAGGGRYDRLLQELGSADPSPGVGCSFWIDRLESLR